MQNSVSAPDANTTKLSFDNFKLIFHPDEVYDHLRFLPSKTEDGKSIEFTVLMAKENGDPYPDEAKKFAPQTMHPSPPAGFD